MSVLSPLNINLIEFKNIKTIKTKIIGNSKIIFLKYDDVNFVVQLSNLSISDVIDSNVIEFNVTHNNIISFFNELDDNIIKLAKNNSQLWFNGNNSINYKSILNENSTIKLKLCDNENLKTILSFNDECINDFSELSNFDNIKVKLILEIYAIQIKSNIFNLILRPINIALTSNNLYNYTFLEEDNDDELSIVDNNEELSNVDNNDESSNNESENNESNESSDTDENNDKSHESSESNDTDENNNDSSEHEENNNEENNDELSENELFIKNILNNTDNISITTSTNSINI
jgi:hypothetical protein